jgi:hypothetical protein
MKAQRAGRTTALPIHNLVAKRGWVVNAQPWLLYHQERDQIPIIQETGKTLGPVWMGIENLAPTGIRTWTI